MDNLYVVIMAGGVGSRFWPASREDRPKQFLDIMNTGYSLIQMTAQRFAKAVNTDKIYISTHEKYRELIREQLPVIREQNILTEPARKNTAPCLAYAALHIHARDPEASILVVPSDHQILNPQRFLQAVELANKFAQAENAIMTLGMNPTRPDTGYGYIKLGKKTKENTDLHIYKVDRFTEKPDRDTATQFLESGEYVWNAGIFLFTAETIIEAFEELAPEVIEPLQTIKNSYGTEKELADLNRVYPTCPSISFDYAIMEKAENTYCLPVDIGWSDLGTWNSLYNELAEEKAENVHKPGMEIAFRNASGNYVSIPDGKKAIIRGLEDFIVIDEGDVLLIWPRDKEQEIKELKNELAKKWNLD